MKRIIFRPALMLGMAALLASCATHKHTPAVGEQNVFGDGAAPVDVEAGESRWPMKFNDGTVAYTVFEPQADSWDGHELAARCAIAVQSAGQAEPTYGVVAFTAITLVDKSSHAATLANFRVTSADFPSARDQTQNFLTPVVQHFSKTVPPLALDPLEASLSIANQPKPDRVNNMPPKIIVATNRTVLVYIDGPPTWRAVSDTGLQRVINTRMLLLKDSAGKCYLHLFDGYLEAPSLQGPWTVAAQPPAGAARAEKDATDSEQVDLMQGMADSVTQKVPSLSSSPVPEILVVTQPGELIQFTGAPQYSSISGTDLLYANNTSGNVFKSLADQMNYVLISGRWYRAASLDGPWHFVPGNQLPRAFANIPDSSPKENVKASVPGTAQAEEALIANSIPQSAAVARTNQMAAPKIDGAVQLAPIDGTPLHYVVNSSTPIIEEYPQSWYACQDGVWYKSASATGPWTVATFVPPVIYTIPPTSPLHYVTYVQVYGASPDQVYEGYTPGYMGTEISDDGTVVYGTGYYYSPWVGTVWYGPPVTWGWGFGDCWTPWWGWGFGCGFGWGWGWGCYPPYPWWGGFHRWHDHDGDRWRDRDGVRGWANTGANTYHPNHQFHGSGSFAGHGDFKGVGAAYNSRTGWLQSGQHASVQNVSGAAWDTRRRSSFAQNKSAGTMRNWSASRNYNYSYGAPRFSDMNRGYESYPKGSWYGGNSLGAMAQNPRGFQGQGNSLHSAAPRSGGGSFHTGGGGGGGGGSHGGGGHR